VLDTRHTDQEEVMQHASGLAATETP
jgi:hypothetical protein